MGRREKTDREIYKASTVILTRPHNTELQVYLLKRSPKSEFMPENYVFPGGRVDREDREQSLWRKKVDMDSEAIFNRFGGDLTEEEALYHGVAAIRETFEEAGVLLAFKKSKSVESLEHVTCMRDSGGLDEGWFGKEMASDGWVLAFSQLKPWSHWITPKIRPKRYDTMFFACVMPQGQECRPDETETTHGIWLSPRDALVQNIQGEICLSPPTLVTLHELLPFAELGSLDNELKSRNWEGARIPRPIIVSQGILMLLPWDPYYNEKLEIDDKGLLDKTLPVGEDFSRILFHEGLWCPVGI